MMVNYFKTLHGLKASHRYKLRKGVSKYLNEIMRDDIDSQLYIPDVSKAILAVLVEGMFVKFSLKKQHCVIELYRENKKLTYIDLDKNLNNIGDKKNLEAFWKMNGEWKPEPKKPDNKKRESRFLYLFG